jgi:hypothetical protein
LSWTTVGGRAYVVQSVAGQDGVTGNFANLSPVISIGGTNEGVTNYLHVGGATNPAGYYRVRLAP